jgi:hypothetical protein
LVLALEHLRTARARLRRQSVDLSRNLVAGFVWEGCKRLTNVPIQLDTVEHSDFLELEIRLDPLPGDEIFRFRFRQDAVRLFGIEPILLVLSAKPLQQMEVSRGYENGYFSTILLKGNGLSCLLNLSKGFRDSIAGLGSTPARHTHSSPS